MEHSQVLDLWVFCFCGKQWTFYPIFPILSVIMRKTKKKKGMTFMTYQFTTKSGSEYAIVPYQKGVSTLLKKGEQDYESIGKVYSPKEEIRAGQPFVFEFTPDSINGANAGLKIRTNMVTRVVQSEEVLDASTGEVKTHIVPAKSYGRSIYMHTASGHAYTLMDTEVPGISMLTQITDGIEYEVFTPTGMIGEGDRLSVKLTDSPINGQNVNKTLNTSIIQSVRTISAPYKRKILTHWKML